MSESQQFSSSQLVDQLIKSKLLTKNKYSDFDRDRLILQMSQNKGPVAAGDEWYGLDDLFLGGSKGESAQLLLRLRLVVLKPLTRILC